MTYIFEFAQIISTILLLIVLYVNWRSFKRWLADHQSLRAQIELLSFRTEQIDFLVFGMMKTLGVQPNRQGEKGKPHPPQGNTLN